LKINAMVTAGGIPQPGEHLYEFSQGESKALIDIDGKPMVQWVLDALSGSKSIDNVVLVGLDPSSGVTCKKTLLFLPNQGGMLTNIRAAAEKVAELSPKAKQVLIVSSDIPAITPAMVDWVVENLQPEDDLLYTVISREVMEARFPNSMRSYTKLKDIELCGGDLNAASMHAILSENGIWEKLADARKNALKQASLVGFDLLLLVLLRRLDLEAAARRASRNLGLHGHALPTPYAEIGMDVDKAHHLETIRRDMASRKKQ
jgi:GTP:adenosylcobinamide-phosphate guanylyltransferase